jgi:Sensors of blue-light using FAD
MSLLRSIVYVSTASRSMDSDALERLLLSAREFNRGAGITGALLYSGTHFMQCFEGPEDAVLSVYQRIAASRLHTELVEYMNTLVPQRAFGEWTMGSATATESELLTLSTAQWCKSTSELNFSPSSPPGLQLLQVFWSMRSEAATGA